MSFIRGSTVVELLFKPVSHVTLVGGSMSGPSSSPNYYCIENCIHIIFCMYCVVMEMEDMIGVRIYILVLQDAQLVWLGNKFLVEQADTRLFNWTSRCSSVQLGCDWVSV